MKAQKNIFNLPLPRFQFTWSSEGPEERTCKYTLVLPLTEYDIRAEDSEGNIGVYDEIHYLLGETNVNGGKSIFNNVVQTPFRDYAHMQFDNAALGGHLPMYAVCGSTVRKIEKQ